MGNGGELNPRRVGSQPTVLPLNYHHQVLYVLITNLSVKVRGIEPLDASWSQTKRAASTLYPDK